MTGGPEDKPAFLDPKRAEAIGYVGAEPDAVPLFDDELILENPEEPSAGIITRYRELARLHSSGMSNNSVAAHLGYTASRVSILLRDPFVQTEIGRYRAQMFEQTVADALKAAGPDAVKHLHTTINDPREKAELRSTNARWVVEKLTGKAKQEVSVESNTLSSFMEILKDMRSRGESLDVTPREVLPALQTSDAELQSEQWPEWIAANL